ncbi:tannase/feruloyl esterase family alpha/beta hydrolase [Duganella sp. BuS-21]|uniref:tannase/feruloyl esterase family alpha/beta hydrolase n=1 Tax=Duganella sp. BuS-21 TaxID=2943848 RepID=UPI0035A67361
MKPLRHLLIVLFAWMAMAPAAQASSDAEARCAALAGLDLHALMDAPTRIDKTEVLQVQTDLPPACQVSGTIDGSIGFLIAMPLDGWNGKYFQTGCGGACGSAKLYFCDEPLKRHYACLGTDMGHRGTTVDWRFGQDLKALVDFGFRATHRATLAGRAVLQAYYRQAAAKSYFYGCSTGGRQALMAAQVFPDDFDGIIAGAPAIDETGAAIQLLWSVLANLDGDGREILHQPQVALLHRAVIEQCDTADGLRDGLIGDPRQCKVNFAPLMCKAGAGDDKVCLTAQQSTAAKKIYSGPERANGEPLYTGGMMPGSEMSWLGAFISADGKPPLYLGFITDLWRYAGFSPAPGPAWKATDFDFERDPQRVGLVSPIFNANNPDLRKFKARGGKMIGFQGWDDNSVVPLNYLDYYRNVVKVMDGPKQTGDFFRLFMVPGMRHCSSDGVGADAINYVEYLEQWVEQGRAPEMMLGSHVVRDVPYRRSLTFPLSNVDFTRPHFPFPAQHRYRGKGDPNDAASFERVEGPQY